MARSKDFDQQEVLDKAVAIFWEKGYHATSMQDLVDGLGIARSSLYDTYGDKHTLFITALESYRAKAGLQMQQMVANAPTTRQAITQLLNLSTTSGTCNSSNNGCFLVNTAVEVAPHDAEVSAIICANDADIEQAILTAIEKGRQNGELSNTHNARALARFIFNTFKGLRVNAKATTDPQLHQDIVNIALSVLG